MSASALARAMDSIEPAQSGRGRGRRRGAALAASLLVHAGFALIVFNTLRGAEISGGNGAPDGDVGVVTISLAGLRGSPRPASGSPSVEAMAALFRQIRAEQSDLNSVKNKPQPKGDLQRLFDVIDQANAAKAAAAGSNGRSATDMGGPGAALKADAANPADRRAKPNGPAKPGGAGTALSVGGLWGQIKPCWDELPSVAAVPVTLVITLDNNGQIAIPPKIVRPSGATPDERRLISEARALTAVTACVPYHGAGLIGAKGAFEVRFGG